MDTSKVTVNFDFQSGFGEDELKDLGLEKLKKHLIEGDSLLNDKVMITGKRVFGFDHGASQTRESKEWATTTRLDADANVALDFHADPNTDIYYDDDRKQFIAPRQDDSGGMLATMLYRLEFGNFRVGDARSLERYLTH